MIRKLNISDFKKIYLIINDAAAAYKGVIPDDRWKDPYMSKDELLTQLIEGVTFWGHEEDDVLIGVMGIQKRTDVWLIRHAYVSTAHRNKGIGTLLIKHLISCCDKPVLIGTWKAAWWAINFYQKHGFNTVPEQEKDILLKKYWNIPERQIETSLVLADRSWERSKAELNNPPA